MLRNAIVVLAIVLGSRKFWGFPPAHLPAAAAMVAVAEVMVFVAITLAAASVLLPSDGYGGYRDRASGWRGGFRRYAGRDVVRPLGRLLWPMIPRI